ncbi:hypothetical protein [Azovibrio restrictus]|nr:hypothetical protein [Azovibrio restrictus]
MTRNSSSMTYAQPLDDDPGIGIQARAEQDVHQVFCLYQEKKC